MSTKVFGTSSMSEGAHKLAPRKTRTTCGFQEEANLWEELECSAARKASQIMEKSSRAGRLWDIQIADC